MTAAAVQLRLPPPPGFCRAAHCTNRVSVANTDGVCDVDFHAEKAYSSRVEANGYGALSFPPHVTTDSLLGKVPSVCGLTSRRSPRQRTAAHGGHFAMKYIPISNGQQAIVDDEDYDALVGCRWSIGHGYARRTIYTSGHGRTRKGASEFMHRVIMNAPRGIEVDHINHNKLDNRRCNLRLVTHTQNAWNRGGRNRSSKYTGVTRRGGGNWHARIAIDGKTIYLGGFNTEIEAARAYDNAALKHRGKYALLNLGTNNDHAD